MNKSKKNEQQPELIIISSSDENSDDECDKNKKSESLNKNDGDDEVFELFATTEKISCFSKYNYYKNDEIIGSSDTLKRWKIKKLTNPHLNYTLTNYRMRVFNDQRTRKPRFFKPGIFISDDAECSSLSASIEKFDPQKLFQNVKCNEMPDIICSNDTPRFSSNKNDNIKLRKFSDLESKQKTEIDKQYLKERLKVMAQERDQSQSSLQIKFNEKSIELKQMYTDKIIIISNDLNLNNHQKIFKKNTAKIEYNRMLNELQYNFDKDSKEINDSCDNEQNALIKLFESGNYKKGKLAEYKALEVYQPKSKKTPL
jgi:hypothetical protein